MARRPTRPARFLLGERLSEGLDRLLPEIAQRAENAVHPSVPAPESIHALRLLVKQTRAFVWLAKPGLSAKAYRKIKEALRDVAGPLGHTRDQAAVISTVHKIVRKMPVAHRPKALDGLKDILNRDADEETNLADITHPAEQRLQEALADMTSRLRKATGDIKLKKRLQKAYAGVHKAGKKALRPAEPEDSIHTWRKVTKRFYYLLPKPDSLVARRRLQQAKDLQKLLGDHHDGTVTRHAVGEHRSDAWKCAWEKHQQHLLARARKLFRRLPHTIPFT